MSTDSRFLFTENVQFSYVRLRCTSSAQRTRSRHGRKAGEEDGSSITAEFELDVNLEEVTGWSLPACLPATFPSPPLSPPQTVKVSPVLKFAEVLGSCLEQGFSLEFILSTCVCACRHVRLLRLCNIPFRRQSRYLVHSLSRELRPELRAPALREEAQEDHQDPEEVHQPGAVPPALRRVRLRALEGSGSVGRAARTLRGGAGAGGEEVR